MKRQPIRFKTTPAMGTTLMIEGQRYELKTVEPYLRKDGQLSAILNWVSHCPVCGDPFPFATGLTVVNPNRRCVKHRAPGKPVCERKVARPFKYAKRGAK
jgi:hypothetical protein